MKIELYLGGVNAIIAVIPDFSEPPKIILYKDDCFKLSHLTPEDPEIKAVYEKVFAWKIQ